MTIVYTYIRTPCIYKSTIYTHTPCIYKCTILEQKNNPKLIKIYSNMHLHIL